MTERWRKPIVPAYVEHDIEAYDVIEGHIVRALKWTLTPDDLNRIKQGYACLNCMEPFEEPRTRGLCPLCRYNLADTLIDLYRQDRGGEHVGPLTTLEEERERHILETARRHHKPGSSILVPRSS